MTTKTQAEMAKIPDGASVVYLLDASSELEVEVLDEWLSGRGTPGEMIRIASTRRRTRTDPRLDARLKRDDDPYLVPVRVVWLPEERQGNRTARWTDLLRLGDPRDPNFIMERLIRKVAPDRIAVVVGEGAHSSELAGAYAATDEVVTFREFATRRAWLSLERAERKLRGNRYKIPKFLHEELTTRPEFGDGAIQFGTERGLSEKMSFRRASYYLREMAASHSPFLIDLIANAIHALYHRGYGAIHYDAESIKKIATLGQEHPLVFLPSHRSHFDRISLQYILWENDLPPNHTAGGINMNFFPIGPLIRRTGVFFIRRSFRGNELYKFVVKQYLDYLIERRFPLEWYIEGGRSRTGKPRPPTYGLLSWVVDSWRRGKAEDVILIPISIGYDEIQDVGAYAAEARGGEKQPESFGWALGAVRNLASRYGNIHVRFADTISVAEQLGAAGTSDTHLEIQKVAFEVMSRISRATPVTPTALVSIALAVAGGKPHTADNLAEIVFEHAAYVEDRGFPITERVETVAIVERVLDRLVEQWTVTRRIGQAETAYWTDFDQSLEVAYYRNMVVHFFLPRAMAEVALVGAEDEEDFWARISELRDLLKFEFFFPEKEALQEEIAADLCGDVPKWREEVEKGEGESVLRSTRPVTAPWALGAIVEAYLVVAHQLKADGGGVDDDRFIDACLERAQFYLLDQRISHDEAISKELFTSGLSLVRNREQIDTEAKRESFSTQMNSLHADLNALPTGTGRGSDQSLSSP
ncbi:MAG: hypothetical protein GEU79_04530 [Acidimicrobiia bacterium]|nr:hypothetical protein [Acidimicrobiia bacterium]